MACTAFPTAYRGVLDHVTEGLEQVSKSSQWPLRITDFLQLSF